VNRVHPQLTALEAALLPPAAAGPIPAGITNDVFALIRGMKRKARFAEMHMALLIGINWTEIDEIGRRPAGGIVPAHLRIPLSEASLSIEHPGAVIDHVYVAFDGLIAALVNMTDTLGRLVNLGYGLQLDPRRSSLFAVRDACNPNSALGLVLLDPQHTDWLSKVRDLRGRCQHADVEDILTSTGAPLGRRGQPNVGSAYSWRSPAQDTPLVSYAQEAIQAAERCLDAAISAIVNNAANPLR
jgi:hypothetical protein